MKSPVKKILAVAVAALGLAAVAAPSVTVDEVTENGTWSKVDVKYTLSGVDASASYKVAFDVTADGATAGVTNDAAQLESKAYTNTIDTAALFGAAKRDAKAKVKVSLVEVKPDWPSADPVQLWEGGPTWATCNVGATTPEGSGALIMFDNARSAVSSKMGSGWSVPTKAQLQGLVDNCDRKWTALNGVNGYLVTGRGDYSSNSIFLPAAGYADDSGRHTTGSNGYSWSSTSTDSYTAWRLGFKSGDFSVRNIGPRSYGFSVRAVR